MITAQSCSTEIEEQDDFLFFQVGYKELCTHMANLHGGLERVMAKDKRQGIKDLFKRFTENGPWKKLEKSLVPRNYS